MKHRPDPESKRAASPNPCQTRLIPTFTPSVADNVAKNGKIAGVAQLEERAVGAVNVGDQFLDEVVVIVADRRRIEILAASIGGEAVGHDDNEARSEQSLVREQIKTVGERGLKGQPVLQRRPACCWRAPGSRNDP